MSTRSELRSRRWIRRSWIGPEVIAESRHQPLIYPKGNVARISVVRIEVLRGATLDAEREKQTVEWLLRSADRSGIAALQVDFDATKSQREFYRDCAQATTR